MCFFARGPGAVNRRAAHGCLASGTHTTALPPRRKDPRVRPVSAHRPRILALALALAGCRSTSSPVAPDAPADIAEDLGADAPMDVPLDLASDVSVDGTSDASVDAPEASSPDAALDARGDGAMRRDGAVDAAPVDVFTDESFAGPELLARPTDRSMGLHLVAARATEYYVEYGTAPGAYTARSETRAAAAGEAALTVLAPLTAGTRYYYRVRHRAPGAGDFAARDEHSFVTRRAPGAAFTFTVQADSHLDDRSDFAVYASTLDNVLRDRPDFHIDLGDTFMCEKHTSPFMAETVAAMDAPTVDARYAFDRANFARVGHSVPVFLVNGNHEGESGWLLDGTDNNLPVWATRARRRYFANPEPDAFYTGPAAPDPVAGARQSWYAFEWGDALFIALDPYWYTRARPGTDRWRWTLGEEQYRWLRRTLDTSTARYRFVFIHHLVGGINSEARGGVEAAPLFEWGGLNEDRTPGFDAHRPGWGMPIHQALRDGHVTAVFHGHDHVYVHQSLDGIAYQEVPQPSASNFNNGAALATEGGYASGVVRSSSGHLRVSVSPERVTVDYVRATPPAGTRIPDGGLDTDSYTLTAR